MKPALGILLVSLAAGLHAQTATVPWGSYGHDAQHTALSTIGAQRLEKIKWSTPVDLTLTNNTGSIYIHYGSPLIAAANTVIVPVRTSTSSTYEVQAFSGATGALLYTLSTDYTPPNAGWIPPYVPTLSQGSRLYYGGANGKVYYRDRVDSATGSSGQPAFYGTDTYFTGNTVTISTPITADAQGDIYFGFLVTNSQGIILLGGLARIGADGTGSWTSASAAAQGNTSIVAVAYNCAPAISNDGTLVYFGVTNGSGGYLVSVNSSTLAPVGRTTLIDPNTKQNAAILDESTASPTIGPDGDVYYGVFETSCCSNHDRGWLLHFDSTLTVSKTPGAFGWDDTASIVPATLVASYTGSSSYLVFTKYNNYIETGGNGENMIAVLDPNAPMTDPITGATVMQEVITMVGPTSNPPGGVREWCINSGAIDPFSAAAMANSEDGNLYRWNFATNTLTQSVNLTSGVGEAYTPTAIGADGTAYAINNAVLFAVGQASNMTIAVTDSGNFTLGENGATYTLTATNNGTAATQGTVTVSDSLPAGLTATSIGGTNWNCTAPSGPCARSDSIGAGASYDHITLTVNIGDNAPASVTNIANVSSDGAPNSVNATASDVSNVGGLPASLTITKMHSGSFAQGQTGATYTVTVSNGVSAGPASGGVTVTETVPSGLTLVSMAGTGWTCPSAGTTCTEDDPLAAGGSYSTITVTVNVGQTAASQVTNQVSVAWGASSTASAHDLTTILQSQTIDFPTIAAVTYGVAPFGISATSSSTLPVTFTSQTGTICSVSNATVTILSGGMCTIQANQAGSASYSPANASQSFTVNPASQSINFPTIAAVTYGVAPFGISATASSTLPVTFTSQTGTICSVSNATVTILAGGMCTIQANQAGSASYSPANASQSFTVNPASQSITAHARKSHLELNGSADTLRLQVIDAGKGFHSPERRPRAGADRPGGAGPPAGRRFQDRVEAGRRNARNCRSAV